MKTTIFFITILVCTLFSFSSLNAQYSKANMAKKNTKTEVQAKMDVNSAENSFLSWARGYIKEMPSVSKTRNTRHRPTYHSGGRVAMQQKTKDELIADCAFRCANQYTGYGSVQDCSNMCNCIYNVEHKSVWNCIMDFVRKQKAKLY